MLTSPGFQSLQWTSLQPNGFTPMFLTPATEMIKQYRKTGKQDTLRVMLSADGPTALVDPYDVGVFAARLLCCENPAVHNKARYALNGPEDITGTQIVKMVEQYIDTRVESVSFKDMSFVDNMAEQSKESKNVILSIKHALQTRGTESARLLQPARRYSSSRHRPGRLPRY